VTCDVCGQPPRNVHYCGTCGAPVCLVCAEGHECVMTRDLWAKLEPKYAHTWDWEEHPDGWDEPCMCADCRSYADA